MGDFGGQVPGVEVDRGRGRGRVWRGPVRRNANVGEALAGSERFTADHKRELRVPGKHPFRGGAEQALG